MLVVMKMNVSQFQTDGHVLMATILIHGVIVDVVLMIPHVMILKPHNGVTVLLLLHV